MDLGKIKLFNSLGRLEGVLEVVNNSNDFNRVGLINILEFVISDLKAYLGVDDD